MKANNEQQERYSRSIVPMEDIQKNSQVLLPNHTQVTEAQAELVHAMLHDGCNPTEGAKRLGRNKAWAYKTIAKQHVVEYRQQIAMSCLGWDATQALATMRDLLNAKSSHVRLEASRDLMDRAGLRVDAPRQSNTSVNINFNVD
jgi:hypothetical protein|tara:strand:+ start:213 stop:644 length:432 start_codon:yes stop_codon:yes gene_type:complete